MFRAYEAALALAELPRERTRKRGRSLTTR